MTNIEPPNQVIATVDEPATMSPLKRWIRTAVQVVAALAVAVPTMAALFDVSAELTAKLTGGMGVLVALVSALHNAYNAHQAAPTPVEDRGESTIIIVVAVLAAIALCMYIFGTR